MKSEIIEHDSSRMCPNTRSQMVEQDFLLVRFIRSYLFLKVPIVTVVVEGGPDTLATIYNDLVNNIPVVLIDVSLQ